MQRNLILVLGTAAIGMLFAGEIEASCTAQVICQVTVIQCNGQSVCESGPDWVRCDGGEQIFCPICQAQTTCCDGRFLYCNGYSSCETRPGRWIKCDGTIQGICPFCPSWSSLPPSPPGGGLEGLTGPSSNPGSPTC